MKTLGDNKRRFCLVLLAAFIMTVCISGFAIAEPNTVAIVPFKMNAEKDLTFLEDGIFDMLSFHLSKDGKVKVMDRDATLKAAKTVKGSLNEARAIKIGKKLRADYVIFGSITVFGNSVSLHAKMTDVMAEKSVLSFFEQSQGMDGVIPKINLFATDLNKKVFDSAKIAPSAAAKTETPVSPVKPAQSESVQPEPKKVVPVKPVQPAAQTQTETPEERSVPNPSFITTRHQKASEEFWKSRDFKYFINGMTTGDVDNDGKIETLMIASHEIYIYRYERDRFHKVRQIKESRYKNLIGIDVADINGNGYPEIFVTSLNAQRNGVESFVLEWNGQAYAKIIEGASWFYRVVGIPGQGDVLLGQKHRATAPFSGNIYEMKWENSSYVSDKVVLPSGRNNVLGLTLGDVTNKGQNVAAVYDNVDHIRLKDTSGSEIWKGDEKYGGTMMYYLLPKTERGTDNPQYLPMRLLVRDLDADGENEVIAVRNYEIAMKLLKIFRKFTKTHIESLSWDGIGLTTNWKTQEVSGHISDFAIGDFDNDGEDELVASIVMKDGLIIGTSAQSAIIAYDLKK